MADESGSGKQTPTKAPISGWDATSKGVSSNLYFSIFENMLIMHRGMQAKKLSPWDATTEELNIPDIEEDGPTIKDIAKAPQIAHEVIDVSELNKNLAQHLLHQIEGVDISDLLQVIKSQNDLVEKDIEWNYKTLQAEMSQAVFF